MSCTRENTRGGQGITWNPRTAAGVSRRVAVDGYGERGGYTQRTSRWLVYFGGGASHELVEVV